VLPKNQWYPRTFYFWPQTNGTFSNKIAVRTQDIPTPKIIYKYSHIFRDEQENVNKPSREN
jgi:threonine aldolase